MINKNSFKITQANGKQLKFLNKTKKYQIYKIIQLNLKPKITKINLQKNKTILLTKALTQY